MRITVFGSGYVGLVTGACFANAGNHVICVDVDESKIERLKKGDIPIFEPGLENMVLANMQAGRMSFTTDAKLAIDHGDVIFIAVGTPPDEDGSADLQYVLAVAKTVGQHMMDYRVVVDKSTVPVGTADKVKAAIDEVLQSRGAQIDFDVVSNPEFLKEGAAIGDFNKPDRIVIGAETDRATDVMRQLYTPFNRNHDRLIVMDLRSAELTKYAANAMLATKISFMNELSNIAERVGADIEKVRVGIGSDPRIGYQFIYPGCGYGGSCFPKDVKALARTSDQYGFEAKILNAVEDVNAHQKTLLFTKLQKHFGDLKGKTIALWGLAFKPNTDDMREAPSRVLMEALWDAGATVQAYDPESAGEVSRIYADRKGLLLCKSSYEALQSADALVICTEWEEFRSPDFVKIKALLSTPVIVDGRNLYLPERLEAVGFHYYSIGR